MPHVHTSESDDLTSVTHRSIASHLTSTAPRNTSVLITTALSLPCLSVTSNVIKPSYCNLSIFLLRTFTDLLLSGVWTGLRENYRKTSETWYATFFLIQSINSINPAITDSPSDIISMDKIRGPSKQQDIFSSIHGIQCFDTGNILGKSSNISCGSKSKLLQIIKNWEKILIFYPM